MSQKINPSKQVLQTLAKIPFHVWGVICLGLLLLGGTAMAGVAITDSNPMRMPAVGDYGLRIISPTLLEVTLINTKALDPATVTNWNFVSSGNLSAPAASSFAVTANGQSVNVQSVGFRRRPIYAPLAPPDLRIGNYIYLQLASSIADGQVVQVKNPSGNLWGSDKQYTATADPFRFSPLIHVNQEGYMPNYAKKAMVGYFLGSMGEMVISPTLGFNIIDANSGATVYSGTFTTRKDVGYTFSPAPYQHVLEADFTAFNTPGEYRLQVPTLGASYPFMIDSGVAALFTRTYALGMYHQRCGYSNDLPYSRFAKGACHSALVSVPDMTYSTVNSTLASMTSDYAGSQSGAPQLKDVNSSLYPFVNKNPINLIGGHHDAGDYSKYTIDVAQLVHSLVFAADAFPGVGALDNLGIPESGDGKSDILQEAKWECDFLAKMQDSDGGFYFLVYPRDRQYEDNVSLTGTDLGDPQVVFPKTTAVTAAAVGALAEAGSSPLMKQQFPTEAANYLAKAKLGWTFLQNAINKYGRAGSYQKITHYGNNFAHNDELAWAAAALFAATGDTKYSSDLMANFDPSNSNTYLWSWWRMFEGYGCAIRTYAFAARTGRLQASQLDPTYLAKCEAQIVACGDDQVRWSQENAYGNSFSDAYKGPRSAGWFFSVNQAFEMATAYQVNPKQAYIDTTIANMNYEGGCNPLNMGFVTGVAWRRQRDIVSQYHENDRRVLPPTGIPQGSVQSGFPYLYNYGSELGPLCYPSDSAASSPYAPYDIWGDTFNTTTELVSQQQSRSLAAMAFLMAQTSVKTQAWHYAVGTITGLPAQVPAKQNITATLSVPGVDMSQASYVWEARDQEPTPGANFTFAAVNVGLQWVEVEALLPDGRRVFGVTNFNASTATNTPPNADLSAPIPVTSDVQALYHLDNNYNDATGTRSAMTPSGNISFDPSNVGWMTSRSGASVHSLDLGDQAVVSIPNSALWSTNTQSISVEAMIYINAYKGYNRGNAEILGLQQNWNSSLEFYENIYNGPRFRGGTQMDIGGATVTNPLTPNVWHHLKISIDKTGYTVKVDGTVAATQASTELANWGNILGGNTTLTIGNFDGWIDEVAVRNVRTGGSSDVPPVVSLTSPINGSTYSGILNIPLTATASDADGSVSKVEFYQGATKLGQATASPYTMVWSNVAVGSYSLTARATDNAGAVTTSSAVSITVNTGAPGTVATPAITPNGGTFSNPVSVTLASTTSGAVIHYTINGSTPSASSPTYVGPFTLSASGVVKAFASSTGMTDSSVASATFTISTGTSGGALPSPWANKDIGSVAFAGSSSFTNGTYFVNGSGVDIWGTADAFQYAYQPWTGDGQIVARVNSLEQPDPWSKAGVMFRETLDAGSSHAMSIISSANGAAFQRRLTTGGTSLHTPGALVTAPYWVKMVRSGSTFSGYSSSDGTNWALVGSDTITMASNIYVGLAVTAHTNTAINHAVFSSVQTTASSTVMSGLDSPWVSSDIGSVAFKGSATGSNGNYSVSGSGADIWNNVDAFQYMNQPWNGDGEIVARVASIQNTDPWAKAGVMFRQSLAANSAHTMTILSSGSGAAFQRRATAGGSTIQNLAPSINSAPYWVRLKRVGNIFTSYISGDGINWTTIGSDTVAMTGSIYVGLVVTAHNNTALNMSAFTDVHVSNGLASPWSHQDVGSVGLTGAASATNGIFTVSGSGADIWNTADAFQFVDQPWTGDGTIIARVLSVQNTDPWAKAAVMFRASLDANSAQAMTILSAGSGVAFQRRITTGGYSVQNLAGAVAAPYWVKLTRTGNVFTSYVSSNGTTWSSIGSETISMPGSIYVGLAVTAHNNSAMNTSTFSNVQVGAGL